MNSVILDKDKYTYRFASKGKWQIAPKWELKILQKILKNYLTTYYSEDNISENATAYIKNKNISYNVDRHQGNNYFFVTDFKNFFPSIVKQEITDILFSILKKEDELSLKYILEIIFYKNKLQYGFPTSPIISNLIMKKFDTSLQDKLNEIFPSNNIQYTRYSDDITVSSKYITKQQDILDEINKLRETEYSFLEINHKKTRIFEKYAHRPYVTGLVPLNKRNTIGKKKYNQLKLNIHLFFTNAKIINDNLFKTEISLSSYLSYIYLVDKHNYNKLKYFFLKTYSTQDIYKLFKK